MLWTLLMTVRWPMMIGIAVMGLYLVNDLLPDQSKLKEAATLDPQGPSRTPPNPHGGARFLASPTPRRNTTRSWWPLKKLLGEEKWAEKMNLLSFEGTVNPEKILSAVLMMSVADGMRGVLVIALIAAALSTFGSWVNLATGQFVNDFYKKWIRPRHRPAS
jgi:solute:Na+ symporter, SSS family